MKKLALLAGLALMSGTVSAEYVTKDYKTAGDASVVFDDVTGKSWLTLDYTVEQSLNDVISRIDINGDLSGWRLPTEQEVHQLLTDVTNANFVGTLKTINNITPSGSVWASLMGETLYGGEGTDYRHVYSYGFHKNESGDVVRTGVYYRKDYRYDNGAIDYVNYQKSAPSTSFYDDYSHIYSGVFLVSDSPMGMSEASDVAGPVLSLFTGIVLLLMGGRRYWLG